MMFLCISRFDLEKEGEEYLKEFFSLDEIEAQREEKEEKLDSI